MISNDLGLGTFLYYRLNQFKSKLSNRSLRKISKFLEDTIYIFSVAGPIMTAPQVGLIYMSKSASGLSLFTWGAYLFISFFWLTYAVFLKNKPLIVANFFWILMHILIIVGIILYS